MWNVNRRLSSFLVFVLLLGACSRAPAQERGAPRSDRSKSPTTTATPSEGPCPCPVPTPTAKPRFVAIVEPVEGEVADYVLEKNWNPPCPVPLSDLRVLTVSYWGFDGQVHTGPLILNADVVQDVRWVFQRLFRHRFPIKRIELARKYRPNSDRWDNRGNRTSSFNCRPVTDGTSLSQHSYGWAIDINPMQNPYVRGDGSVLRKAAKPYRDRTLDEPGMIYEGDIVVRSFARIGWEWGGDWNSLKDYMHFSLTGK